MKPRNRIGLPIALLLALMGVPTVGGQQRESARHENRKNEPKRPSGKIWTNEDLVLLRRPWDIYLERKVADEEAAKAAEQAARKAARTPPDRKKDAASDLLLPSTPEEAEARITEKREEIRNQVKLIQRKREEYLNEREELTREALKNKIELLTRDLDDAEAELKLLEARLQELKAEGRSQPPEQLPQAGTAGPPPRRGLNSSRPPYEISPEAPIAAAATETICDVAGWFELAGMSAWTDSQSNSSLEIDASIATLSQGGSGGWINTSRAINSLTIVGGRIQNQIKNINTTTRNVFFDRHLAQGGFTPPWFPSTALASSGVDSTTTSYFPAQNNPF